MFSKKGFIYELNDFLRTFFREYEDGVSSVPVITWEDFLPKIASPDGKY